MIRSARSSRLILAGLLLLGSACSAALVRRASAPAAVPAAQAQPPAQGVSRPSAEDHAQPEEDDDGEPELVEDDAEDTSPTADDSAELDVRAHPLDGWSPERIREAANDNLAELGSMSIGSPNAGALLNGKRAEKCALYEPVAGAQAYGTEETLSYLARAIQKVHEQFPDTPPLALGDISAAHGGPIRPHVSHQAGRDVDISFYYLDGTHWYARGTEKNLDLARIWAFVRALITETDVEMILVDHRIQGWLRRYAIEHGEDRAWVESLFAGSSRGQRVIVRHAPGHATHLHIRFFNPIAQETARRAQAALASTGHIPELVRYIKHRARRGETLSKIAKKYGVSVAAIRHANGLRSSRIRDDRVYRIPVRGRAPPSPTPLKFPSRRLPPEVVAASTETTQRLGAVR